MGVSLKYHSEDTYNLVGFCQDGALTLGIAQQLKQQGKSINLLGLIDVVLDKKRQEFKLIDRIKMLQEFDLVYLKPRIKNYLDKIKTKLDLNKNNINESEDIDSETQEKVKLDKLLYKNYWKAIKSYDASTYNGKIVSFRTLEWKNKDYSNLEKIAQNQLEVIDLKSTHHSLFEESYINLLIQALQKHL